MKLKLMARRGEEELREALGSTWHLWIDEPMGVRNLIGCNMPKKEMRGRQGAESVFV